MIDAVARGHGFEQRRIHALQASHVVAVVLRVGAAPVMRVNPAVRAEPMLCGAGVELVEPKRLLPLHHAQSGKRNGAHDGSLAAAQRAVAAAGVDDTLGQHEFQHHGAAMAGGSVLRKDVGVADAADHGSWQEGMQTQAGKPLGPTPEGQARQCAAYLPLFFAALAARLINPSVTMQPATLCSLPNGKTARTSAAPNLFSRNSGSSNSAIASFTKVMSS